MTAPRHAIVTGASRGLGRRLALSLAAQPETASLTLLARERTTLEEVADTIRDQGFQGRIEVVTGDLGCREGMAQAASVLTSLGIAYNVLVNNAGSGSFGPLETAPTHAERTVFLNLVAPLWLCAIVVPMARSGRFGRIVSISSMAALRPSPDLLAYSMAKAGLMALAEGLCTCEAANGITANTVCPGLMLTDMGRAAIRQAAPDYCEWNAEEIEAAVAQQFPAGRMVDFDEVCAVVSFLVSDAGAGVNGEFIRVASGLL